MERLTIPDVRVDEHTTRRSVIDVLAVREHAMEIYHRLKAYEDTGLTPEEIKDSCTPTTVTIMAGQTLGVHPCRLRELAEADKDGRCVVLPCKVYETDGVRVYEHAVRGIIYRTAGGPDFDESAIGKSMFLTSEEAERAMEGRKEADHA